MSQPLLFAAASALTSVSLIILLYGEHRRDARRAALLGTPAESDIPWWALILLAALALVDATIGTAPAFAVAAATVICDGCLVAFRLQPEFLVGENPVLERKINRRYRVTFLLTFLIMALLPSAVLAATETDLTPPVAFMKLVVGIVTLAVGSWSPGRAAGSMRSPARGRVARALMPTPAIRIDLDIDEPLHEQIFAQLCNMIEIGGLTQGARLPTVRDLARNLRIAPNTVVHAYARLQEYGLVFSDGRRGTIVAGAARCCTLGALAVRLLTLLSKQSPNAFELEVAPPRILRAPWTPKPVAYGETVAADAPTTWTSMTAALSGRRRRTTRWDPVSTLAGARSGPGRAASRRSCCCRDGHQARA